MKSEVHNQEAMARLRERRTSFVIAHRLSTIRDADTIVVMDGGESSSRAATPSCSADAGSTTASPRASSRRPGTRR
jgi:ATP-binding cassette subfamily B protein